MLKRALALLLTGCMMFDSSAITTLAAELQTEVVSEVETEEVGIEENEMVSEDVIIEGETGEETNSEEKTETEEVNLVESVGEVFEVGSNSVTISVTDTMQKYSFTVPETGVYSFHFYVENVDSDDLTNIYLYRDAECTKLITGFGFSTSTHVESYMQEGETIYLQMCTMVEGGLVVDAEISRIPEYEMVKQEDGSYTADTSEYVFNVMSKMGYENLKTEVSLVLKGEQEIGEHYYVYYGTMDHAETVYGRYSVLTYYNNYLNGEYFSLKKETENEFYYILKDDSGNPLAVYTTGETFSRKTTDKSYFIYDTVIEDGSIMMEMEVLEPLIIGYAPTDGSERQEFIDVSIEEWSIVQFPNLKPRTEYSFSIQKSNGEILDIINIATLESTVEIEMDAVYNEVTKYINITANVSGYKGCAEYAYFYCQYTDALGRKFLNEVNFYLNNTESEEDGKSGFISKVLLDTAFLAGTDYEVTLWIELGNTEYERKVVTITTPEVDFTADDISFSVTDNETSDGAVVNVSIAGLEEQESVRGTVFYKLHGETSNIYTEYGIAIGANGSTGYLSRIQKGVVYDYCIIADGVMKELTIAVGEAEVSLLEVEEGINNAFDIVRTFKLEGKEELSGTYYIRMEYRKEGDTSFEESENGVELNTENHYQAEYKSAEDVELDPNTEYQIKWIIAESSVWGREVYTVFENVKTAEADFTVEDTGSYYNEQSYTIALNQDSIVNFSSFRVNMYAHIRKQGEEEYTYARAWAGLSKSNDYTDSFTLENLEPLTTYEMSLRNVSSETDNYTEYAVYTFTTKEDTRKITDNMTMVSWLDYVSLYYSISGLETAYRTYIYAYLREAGTENAWMRVTYQTFDKYSEPDHEIVIGGYYDDGNYTALKENTTYEYCIGIGNGNNTDVDDLKNRIVGQFSTPEDTRTFSDVTVKPYLTSAEISYKGENLNIAKFTTVSLYVRKAGTETEWYEANDRDYTYDDSPNDVMPIYYCFDADGNVVSLQEETTYEYQLGIRVYEDGKYVLKNVVSDTFTTGKDMRTIQAEATPGYADVSIHVSYAGNIYGLHFNIYVFCRQKGTEEWSYMTSAQYIFESGGLNRHIDRSVYDKLALATTYEYVAVIADEEIESPDEITTAEHKFAGEFTTKANPYTVSLNVNEKSIDYDKAAVTVTAENGDDRNVRVTLNLLDENGAAKSETVLLESINDYKKDVTFAGLTGNTTYRITNAVIEVNGLVLGTIPCEASFTTKEAPIPASVMLSAESIILNVYSGNAEGSVGYVEGFNAKTLTVKTTPADVADDFIWNTDTPSVVSIMDNGADEGMIYATGCGDAVITVTSKYDPNITASCNVKVVDYEIIYTDGENRVSKPTGFTLNKGDSLKGLAYYEVENDSKTLLEGYTVTPVKSGVVSWSEEEQTLIALNIGETEVIFEKDGVKAVMTVIVQVEPTGFAISGLDVRDSDYEAIKNTEGIYIAPLTEDATYQILGKTAPVNAFDAEAFTWTSSDTRVAVVNRLGQVIPVRAGTVTITATPPQDAGYKQDEDQITITFKELPVLDMDMPFYAVTNVLNKKTAKLSDIALPEGWTWTKPSTVLIPGGIGVGAYRYTAEYTGDEYYPAEEKVSVYVSKITGLNVYEKEGSHNRILQVGCGSMKLAAEVAFEGIISSEIYTVEIPEVEGLTIEKGEDGCFIVKAKKAGTYTLKPIVKVNGTEVKLKKTVTYKITVVEKAQAAFIEFTDAEGKVIEDNKVIFKTVEEKENFVLNAIVKDVAGNIIDSAKVAWKITDAAVAKVKADKKNICMANVTVKGEGHAVITVTAQDKTKYQATLDLEIQNHKPRVSTNKATVNLAYDYESEEGKRLAAKAGSVEIVPVYGETVERVQLLDKTGEAPVDELAVIPHSKDYLTQYSEYNYLVVQTENSEELKTGKRAYTIRATVYDGETYQDYDYPLTVTISDKKPTVKVGKCDSLNLFYRYRYGHIYVTTSAFIKDVKWNDNSDGVGNGFSINTKGNTGILMINPQNNLEIIKGKLKDKDVAKGTLTFEFDGYKDSYELKNFTVKYYYKKPSIVSVSTSSNVSSATGQNENSFELYNKTEKAFSWYSDITPQGYNSGHYEFTELTCEDKNVDLSCNIGESRISYKYHGTKNSYKFTMTLNSGAWREPINVTHTVKVKNPTPVLTRSNVTFNLDLDSKGRDYTYVEMSDNPYVDLSDIAITGKNKKSQALIENNVLMFLSIEESGRIDIYQNDAKIMGTELKKGTYSYKVTPYVTNAATGQKTALKTLNLTVKIVDTPCKAKVSAKGSIDLSMRNNSKVRLDESFTNLPTGNYIGERWLEGEYADYFKFYYYEDGVIYVNSEYFGSLKAGQTYEFSIGNKIYDCDGNYITTVMSNTFKITPKQKAPKVTVRNNNQTLYAAADKVSRRYEIDLSYEYSLEDAYGSLDCNKDGKTDIKVTRDGYASLKVEIVDRDAVVASAKGKAYTIPVTLKLEGRDGISKDASVSLKVTVKR